MAAQTSDLAPDGKLLEIKLRSAKKPLEVSAFYAVYSGHPVVRKWIAITNRSDNAIRLSHLVFEALNLQAAPRERPDHLRLLRSSSSRDLFHRTGRRRGDHGQGPSDR